MQNINEITVKQGQSLLDIAIQSAGTAEAAFALALNNGLSISDTLSLASCLNPVDIQNKRVYNYYTNNRLIPATALTSIDIDEGEGIEYWYIEIDFEVS